MAEVQVETEFLEMLKEIVENDSKKTDDCIAIAPIAFWTQVFAKYFLHVNNPHHDDLLFYIKKDHTDHHDKVLKKSEVKVFRRESPKNPGLGDPSYDWTETVYLNLILQQLQYTLTCAICSRKDNNDVAIHKRISQTVFASPSRHDMDAKGHSAQLSYPNIFFTIDSFDEIWTDLHLNPKEMVCVEIVAHDKSKSFQSVIFLGSVNYEALTKVYMKKIGNTPKWASFVTMGFYKSPSDIQFVKMKGPGGKGYAEMAVEKYNAQTKSDEEDAEAQSSSSTTKDELDSKSMVNSKSEPVSLYKQTILVEKSASSFFPSNHGAESLPPSPPSWRRPSANSLKTQLTYVTLPWHKIVLDVLRSYENPKENKKPVLGL